MKKRILSFLISVVTVLSVAAITVEAESYWDVQKDYLAALESGDGDAILSAVERIEAVYSDPTTRSEFLRLAFPRREAGYVYESLGQFDLAAEQYGKFLEAIAALDGIEGSSSDEFYSYKNTVGMLYRHNNATPTVFAETSDVSDIPYYGARGETQAGVFHGMSGNFDEDFDNARILYVQFFDEDIEPFKWQLPKTDNDYVLMLAWNVPNENLEDLKKINDGSADEYIRRNLEYLSTLDCRILLRFGGEVNCWGALPSTPEEVEEYGDEFIAEFISAFRRVADAAHEIAPNVGMVYSPNDVSNFYFSIEDFYPGDEYVDWVGMSAYCNRSSITEFERGTGTDAYYCRGDYYENQIVKIQPIVEAFGDRKPIVITEGGYCYKGGVQSEEHAAEAMRFFYTYVSRVYPQIKCIMYFNTNISGNYYKLFGSGEVNSTLGELYRSLNANNCAMSYSMTGEGNCGYTEIRNIDEYTDELRLSVYADYPSLEKTEVLYYLDGQLLDSEDSYPYSCNLTTADIGVGGHLLAVKTSCENTAVQQYYKVKITKDGKVTVSDAIPEDITDVSDKFWGREAIAYGMATELFNGMSDTTFEPASNLTRGMFVTILGRAAGVSDGGSVLTAPFDDIKVNDWYAPYVSWARENEIVRGIDEDHFCPMQNITREQICVLIVRYAEYAGIELPSVPESLTEFDDDIMISSYARDAVYIAKAAGLVDGRGDNKFEPDALASRAEAATVFMRFAVNYLNK